MPHPDEQSKEVMPTLEEIANRNGFTFPAGSLKLRFTDIKPTPGTWPPDKAPPPQQRDLPKPPAVPEPKPVRVEAAAMLNHTASVEQMMQTVSRMDILEGRINIPDTIAQIAAMEDAQAQAKAFMTMEALCDFNLVEQMRVVARRKSRLGMFTTSKALTMLAQEVELQAEEALKEAQK